MVVVVQSMDPVVVGSWMVPALVSVSWSYWQFALEAVGAVFAAALADGTSRAAEMTFQDVVVVVDQDAVHMVMGAVPESWADTANTHTFLEASVVLAGHTVTVHADHDSAVRLQMLENSTAACGILGDMVAACVQLP